MTCPSRITLDPTVNAWDRQPGETVKKYNQFTAYRDLGLTRTLTQASEKLTLSYGHVRNLSTWYRWTDRVAAWDQHLTDQYKGMLEQERRRAAEADVKILRAMTGMLGQALPNLQPNRMTWSEFTRLAETTMRLRRQLLGDPTEATAAAGPGGDPLASQLADYKALPPEQRRTQIAELAEEVARRAAALEDADDD